jgi:hypothetical protein
LEGVGTDRACSDGEGDDARSWVMEHSESGSEWKVESRRKNVSSTPMGPNGEGFGRVFGKTGIFFGNFFGIMHFTK